MTAKLNTDMALLDDLLDNHADKLRKHSMAAFKAFGEWREDCEALTQKQSTWLHGVAERIGAITAAPSENVFSALSKKRQAEQRERAAAVKLPWEQDGEVTRYLVGQVESGFVVREVQARFVEHEGKRGYVCKLRSGHRVQIEWIPEEKVHETATAALTRKKELEKECRRSK